MPESLDPQTGDHGWKTVLTWVRESDEHWFHPIFEAFPSVRVLNARVTDTHDAPMDGLLLTGGSDISSGHLRQPLPNPGVIQDPDPERDAWEFEIVKRAVAMDIPILAICRGLQVLNVAMGGTLHLDIPGHDSDRDRDAQPLRYLRPSRRRFELVNSSHHQALDKLAPGLEILAVNANDGVVEEAWMPRGNFVVGTQFHPERGRGYLGLFHDFFDSVTGAGRPVCTEES